MSLDAKRQAQAEIDEARRLLDNAYKGAMQAAEGRAKEIQQNSEVQTQENTDEEISTSRNFSLKIDSSGVSKNDIDRLRSIGRKPISKFTPEDIKKAEPFARILWNDLKEKSPFFRAWFGDWRKNDGTPVNVVSAMSDTRGLHKNNDTGWEINRSAKVQNEKHDSRASISGRMFLPYIDGIIENAILLNSEISDNENENSLMFHSLYAVVNDGNNKGVIKLMVEELKNPGKSIERRAYKLVDIEKLSTVGAGGSLSLTSSRTIDSINNISQLFEFVKTYDKEFNPKPSSAVVDENGMPKVVYHGTSRGGFTYFDTYGSNFGLFGQGSYFTEDRNIAEQYTHKGKGDKQQVYECYLDIKKPIDMDAKADIKQWTEALAKSDEIVVDFDGCVTNEDCFRRVVDELAYNDYTRNEAHEFMSDLLGNTLGYDGITHIGGGRSSKSDGTAHRVWIAFNPEQIKSATDNIGTFDKGNADINFSLKGGIKINSQTPEMLDTIEELQNGDKSAADRLTKYVDSGMISTEAYKGLIERYGAIPKGENPHRDIQVPKKTADDKKVSQTVRTILEAKATPDEAVPTLTVFALTLMSCIISIFVIKTGDSCFNHIFIFTFICCNCTIIFIIYS